MLIASDALMAGKVRMIRLETAVGPFVPGLTEKREKVPHPGLQHVGSEAPGEAFDPRLRGVTVICFLNLSL